MIPRYIDTHAHLNFQAFQNDADAVIQKTLKENVWMINVGSQFQTSKKAAAMAKNYEKGVYAAIGLHPTHAIDQEWNQKRFDQLLQENREKIVAIGETGLDFFRLPEKNAAEHKDRQQQIFSDHIHLAKKYNLPLVIHCRDAYVEVFKMIQNENRAGVIHCFVGNLAVAKQFLDLGYMISFTGIITFTKNIELIEVVKWIPLEKLMIETDCPYLAPVPVRGKRNEPLYVRYIGDKIANIKGITSEEVLRATTENAIKFFHLQE